MKKNGIEKSYNGRETRFLEQRVTLEEFNTPARNEIGYDFYQNGNFIVEI